MIAHVFGEDGVLIEKSELGLIEVITWTWSIRPPDTKGPAFRVIGDLWVLYQQPEDVILAGRIRGTELAHLTTPERREELGWCCDGYAASISRYLR